MPPIDIALIGCGNMGAALLGGYATANPGATLLAVDPDTARARSLLPAGSPVALHPSLDALRDADAAMTVLAVKPQMMEEAMTAFAPCRPASGLVVSIAAGVSTATLRRLLPGARLVRAMPNTPALAGAGYTGLWAEPAVGAEERARCEALFRSVGAMSWLDAEDGIDAVTAMSGSGPAYFFAMVEAMVKAGQALGLPPALASDMARATMAGAAAMLRDPQADPARLKAAVRSPNGTTDAALRVFEAGGALDTLVRDAVTAAHARSVALRGG